MRRFIGTILLAGGMITAGVGTASAAPLPTCKSADLVLTVGREGGAAGTHYRELKFTYRSLGACVLKGFPGVSYVDSAGAQIGRAAYRDGETGELLTLAYGGSVAADVGFANPGNYDPAVCRPQTVWGLKVFPPDETVPLYLQLIDEVACSGPVDAVHTTAIYRS
jgi:hypothetical protein